MIGSLDIEMCLLANHDELIDRSGLCGIISKSDMAIIGTQNLLTGSHVKTTRYCIKVAASAIYLKLTEAHRRLSSDLEPIEWLEEVSKTTPMCSYWKMIIGLELEILLCVRSLRESSFQLYISALARFIKWFFAMGHYKYAMWCSVHLFHLPNLEFIAPSLYE